MFRQSNHEGEIVDWIQEARAKKAAGIVINAGAYTHTSVAILDALVTLEAPVIEVHITNIHARERFRQHSYVSKAARAVVCGFGIDGYALAIDRACRHDRGLTVARKPERPSMPKQPAIDHELIRDLAKLLDETGLTEIDRAERRQRARRASTPRRLRRRRVHDVSIAAPVATRRGRNRSGETSRPRHLAHGRHRLCRRRARRAAVRRDRHPGERRRTLLIIEAMKTMNQIPAPRSGTVIQILIEDGQPVEFGEPLMIIE